MTISHTLPARQAPMPAAQRMEGPQAASESGDSFVSSPAGYALGGAILGAIPGVGAVSNFYGCLCAVDSKLMQQNGMLGAAAAVAGFAGLAANLLAVSGGPPLPAALGLLAFSSATSALNAYLGQA
ncbi:MAG: hypothetical protein HY319_22800 [Armatimonadetes bacterium]|nr:hypothetical protein [Armatimonadota bacterium]